MRSRLWVAFLVPLGAMLAFLSLEGIGIPLVIIALGLIVFAGRRRGDLGVLLMLFGAGFLTSVIFFATVTSGVFRGQADLFGAGWFASHFAFGVALLVTGWILQARRPRQRNL